MFDANMRHLPKDMKFFAEFRGVDKDNVLYEVSMVYRAILCTMLSVGHDNPSVSFHMPDGSEIIISHKESDMDAWIVYAGKVTGKDFLEQFPEVRSSAKKYLQDYYPEKLELWEDDGK